MRALDIRLTADGARLRVNAPKGALSAALRARIAERKQAILDFLRRGELPGVGVLEPIPRASADQPSPLSPAQERLWFLEMLEPGGSVFNLCRALRICGDLNIAVLEASVNAVMRRQEALRARFFPAGGGVAQAVAPFRRLRLKITDRSRLPSEKRERECARLISAIARKPFDLAGGGLLRASLLRLSAAEHLLVLCTHHMVADAWSMGLLVGEIWTHYAGLSSGQAPAVPELPVQYRDYALWQRRRSAGPALETLIDYWQKQLDGAPQLALPTDRPRPARLSYRGKRCPIVIPEPLTAALNELSRRENATLFMTLLAAFQLLLHRYTGQDEILVGTPVANRQRPELEAVIGLFVNTLVLRGDLSRTPSFREVLQRVRSTCLDAFAKQDLPFEKLIDALNPPRQLNRHPLIQTMFVLQNTPRPAPVPAGIRVESVEVEGNTAQFELSLYLRERDGRLVGYFEYARDFFDDSTIERMAGHFMTLLQSIVTDPDQAVATLSLLSAAERHRQLVEWNDTACEFSDNRTIHELFEAQAERTPNAIALECDGGLLTYRELNLRANQLAHYLRRLGAGAQSRVGLMIEREAEMAVGLLGILKAGAAYVPLDPSYPGDRLRFMLDDAQVAVLLTQEKLVEERRSRIEDGTRPPNREALSSILHPRLNVVQLDRHWPTIANENDKNPVSGARANDAAYVIYTSGSTGVPKGVVGLHRGAVNRCAWMWRRYSFAKNEVCCAKTSLSFVDSVWEIFGPLLHGVALVLVPDEIARAPRRLVRFLAEHDVTRIVLVPSLLQAILDEIGNLEGALPRLRLWSCSGEALPASLAQRFKKSHPRARLLNLYGSAEVAADVTCFEYGGREQIPFESFFSKGEVHAGVPIGRPIDNTQIYLLDAERQPVPIGAAAELYVGGAGVARGYWRRAELTEEKFLANPYSSDAHARLFRTGDRARYLPDGNIEFLGRLDQQVKLRGQRIELGEVEGTLRAHPAIRDCVVVVSADGWSSSDNPKAAPQTTSSRANPNPKLGQSLIAYVVSSAEKPSAAELRAFLKKSLPEYMIPASFVRLDQLPLGANGKIDRQSLAASIGVPLPGARQLRVARTRSEKTVAAVWRELLQLDEVGVDDDFFAVGGHSLLAVTLVSRLGAVVDREISLGEFLAAPTIAALAAKLADGRSGASADALPPIAPLPLSGELPLSLAQEQFFKLDELVSGASFLHLPYAYRLDGPLDIAALRRSLQTIVERHAVLRTFFKESHGRLVQIVRAGRRVGCRLCVLSHFSEERQKARLASLSKRDAERPFDLANGPPVRFTLLRLGEQRHVLFVTLHHIIADQSSLRLFRAEMAKLYEAFARSRAASLADLPFQFADFTRWQAAQLKSGKLDGQIDYWRHALAGAAPTLMFRPGKKRPRIVSPRVARRTLAFDDELFAKVRALARRLKTTAFVILVAALDVWLYRLTDCRDLRIGTLVANRNRRGVEKLIGYFVNAVVLRGRVAPRLSFTELIEQTRRTAHEAFAHQDVPIEVVARALQQKKSRQRAGLYQVLVNYRRFEFKTQKAAGLTIASYSDGERAEAPEIAFTSADLTFDFRELSTKLTVSVNFKVDLFDPAVLDRLIASFAAVVEQAVAEPDRRLGDWPQSLS